MKRVSYAIACPVVFILLYNLNRHGTLLKLMKKSVLSIFSGCVPFPQNFGQALAHVILFLVIIFRVFYIFACPVLFILF